MSTTTTVLALTKPASDGSESLYPDGLNAFNSNMDTIDSAIGAKTVKTSATTVANDAAETVVHSLSISANEPKVATTYKIVVWGQASVTATPTLTFRLRVGGLTGTIVGSIVVTAASGVTGKSWRAKGEIVCITTGAAGTWNGVLQLVDDLNTVLPSGADANTQGTVTRDTTIANTLALTVQWSAASASNTCTAMAGYAHRVSNS